MLLGKLFHSPSVSSYAAAFTHNLAADPKRDTVLLEEPVHKKLVPVEQFTATFFTHLLEQAQKHAGFPVVDCVIAVPAHFGQWERQAVLDSAKIAGFNVLSLINGPSSGKFNSKTPSVPSNSLFLAAFFKITTATDVTEATNFIIFDSGAGGTSATLVSMDPKREVDGVSARFIEVKAVASEEGLGGDLIDDRIAAFLRQKFEAAHPGLKVTPGKAYNKVLIEAAKIKKILNTNDHVSVSLDDLIDEAGLMIPRLQREDVDALLTDLSDRFVAPVKKVLAEAGMADLSGIHSILMIGGNSRHQFVLKALKSAFGPEKLSVTLDPDESIVQGATLFAAKLHPAFRLRPVHFADIFPSALAIEYSKLPIGEVNSVDDLFALPWAEDQKSIELFPPRSPLAGRKSLTLKHHDSLLTELKASASGEVFARVAVSGFEAAVGSVASAQRTVVASKLRIPVQLTLSGQVVIEPPVAVIDYEEIIAAVNEDKKSNIKTTEPKATAAADGDEKEPTEQKDETLEQIPVEQAIQKTTVKKFTKTIPLQYHIQYRIPPLSDDAIKTARGMIEAAKAEELKKVALAMARNDLEQSVYHWQAEVTAQWFVDHANKGEKSQMTKAVQKASSLLEDKKAAQLEDPIPYQKAWQEIKTIQDVVKAKQMEWEGRPAAMEALHTTFAQIQEFLVSQQAINPEERAVTDAELNDLKADLMAAEKWSSDAEKKSSYLAKHDQPTILIVDLQKKAMDLKKFLIKLKAKKFIKPKPEVKKEAEAKKEEADSKKDESEAKKDEAEAKVREVHEQTHEQTHQQAHEQTHEHNNNIVQPQEGEFIPDEL